MPSTGFGFQVRPNLSSYNSSSASETFNTAKYLLHNDDDRPFLKDEDRIPTPDIKSYLKLTEPDDRFPTLSRRDGSSFVSHISCPPCTVRTSFANEILALSKLGRFGLGQL
jgi:hypothetical protein